MCHNNSINNVIKYIASFDSSEGSSTEIDTKKEFEFLGDYLNGSLNVLAQDNETGAGYVIKYTDLIKEEKQQLFAIMNDLKSKFGEWTNVFASDSKYDEENALLYVNRLLGYKQKLEELKDNKEEYSKYYKDNKKEIKQVENYVKEYCKQNGLNIKDYSIANLEKLQYNSEYGLSYDKEAAAEIKNMLDESDKFVLTNDIVKKYKFEIHQIINSEEYAITTLTDEQMDKLKDAVLDYIKVHTTEFTRETITGKGIEFCLGESLKVHNKLDTMEECNNKIQNIINNPYNIENLKNTVEKYIKDNNITEIVDIPDGVDVGNGKFDKTSTQQTENCWAHAGINSMLSSETGKTIIESNYYRDEKTGVIAVHLQEAEDMGLHGGIYIITPQEIIDSQETIASGEGEISAYLIAIQKYFSEVNSNPEFTDNEPEYWRYADMEYGNMGFRFYELMTGGKYVQWKYYEGEDLKVQQGIATSTSIESERLYEMIESGSGAMTISLRNIAHNISIIGVKDGKFLIQESNNSETIFDELVGVGGEIVFTVEEPVNGRPTYGILKENIDMYNLGAINYIKWK